MRFSGIVFALQLLVAASTASATTVTLHLEGVLAWTRDGTASEELESPGGLSGDFGIAPGTPFSVTIELGTSAVDQDESPQIGIYRPSGSMNVLLGSVSFGPGPGDPLVAVRDDEDHDDYVEDSWQVIYQVSLPPEGFFGVVLAQWTLRDFDHTALASDAYVPDPTVLTGWDESFFTMSQGRIWTCHPLPRALCNVSQPEYRTGTWFVLGHVDAVRVVPEPGRAPLVALALIAMALARTRNSSRTSFGTGGRPGRRLER